MTLGVHLFRRILSRGRVIGLLALSAVPGLVIWLAGFDAAKGDLTEIYTDIVASGGYTYVVAALILTVATLRDERDSGTLPYLYLRPISRLNMAAQSIAAGMAAALLIGAGGWLATLLAALALGAGPSLAMPALVMFGAAGVGYAAVFVPLGYLIPRSLLVGLGYIVVIETILANVVTGLAQFSIWRIALSMYGAIQTGFGQAAIEGLGPVTPGVGGALFKLLGIVVAGLAVLTWALRKRDAL